MFSMFTGIIYASELLLFILSWISGSKSSRLLYGGSAERLRRKTRKQMVWAAYLFLPAASFIIAALLMTESVSPVFWEDRVLLHLPLTVVPVLAIWFLSMPRLWKLWSDTRKLTGAPLPADIRRQAAHPMIIVPFQMSALGAVTVFYFLLVSPVPLHLTKAIVPILLWISATAALWFVYDRRYQRVSHPEAVIGFHPWRRALRGLRIFCVAAGVSAAALVIESQKSKLPGQRAPRGSRCDRHFPR